jgi:hypothetical protein
MTIPAAQWRACANWNPHSIDNDMNSRSYFSGQSDASACESAMEENDGEKADGGQAQTDVSRHGKAQEPRSRASKAVGRIRATPAGVEGFASCHAAWLRDFDNALQVWNASFASARN